ncbi:MAG: DDE-type integrase/transposase/recombinase [Thermoproteota archaeon]|nr:DDE-type integrase/transposase/recombinase [Thermoproteota archaeon]
MKSRNRTPSQIIGYGLYLYFLGLSFRNAAKALSFLLLAKISHVSIWNWVQRYKPTKKYRKNKKIIEFIVDETAIKAGSELIWLWVVVEPTNDKEILSFHISKERNMFVAERFLSRVVNKYGLHRVSSDGGTWYPQACKFLKLNHHLHSSYEKSIIERTMQYIKDRTENFDDYFPCKKNKCKLNHIKQWLKLFVYQHNKEIIS